MTISHREQLTLICPQCGGGFTSDLWLIVDAQEQPAAREAMLHERFHRVTCPNGHTFAAPAPLLYHDRAAQLVVFVPPPATDEIVWRDTARDLHAVLVGSIPIEERGLYLADVQITQDLSGLAHLLRKAERKQQPPARIGRPITDVLPRDPVADAPPLKRKPKPTPTAAAVPTTPPRRERRG
ncbi:MAG: hypothetical protein HC914_05760 [Chloroflexaceae bacterium]|nr:hypothetical protein [Chloroflexaceae bacterium]